jgi:hypothetical protein
VKEGLRQKHPSIKMPEEQKSWDQHKKKGIMSLKV